jgi:hypothetical protein
MEHLRTIYWFGNFNSCDPTHMIDMDNKVYANYSEDPNTYDEENDEHFLEVEIEDNGTKEMWIAMLYRYDVGEEIRVNNNRETLITQFVEDMFEAIMECTLDDIGEDVIEKYNLYEIVYGKDGQNYLEYLKSCQLEMCFSPKSLILYLQDHDNLVLKVPSELLSEIVIKHVKVVY